MTRSQPLFASTSSNETQDVAPLPGEAFVFRDFERSKVAAVRDAIESDPIRLSALFVIVVSLWTVLMTAGVQSTDDIALNLTPHVALYCVALGVFIYPLRLAWVPVLTFIAAYLYVLIRPVNRLWGWENTSAIDPNSAAVFLVTNLLAAVTIGFVLRVIFSATLPRTRPHVADLVICLTSYFVFIAVGAGLLFMHKAYGETLTPSVLQSLGLEPPYSEFSVYRIFRGGAVMAAFLLAAIELPKGRNALLGLIAAMSFPLVGLIQLEGFALYPALDTAMFALILIILLPVPSGITACVVGIPMYSYLTGQYLNDVPVRDEYERALLIFSIFSLFMLVFVLAFRSRSRHVIGSLSASMGRLNRVQGFAGVGLFSINTSQSRYRVDKAAADLLSVSQEGTLADFLLSFSPPSRDMLTAALTSGTAEGTILTLEAPVAHQRLTIIRLLVWSEKSQTGDTVSYGLILDETADAERNQKLSEAVNALSARDEKQRQLFSIVSHEVRTPAATLSMLIDELQAHSAEETLIRKRLRDTADHLLTVLGDMRQAIDPEKNMPVQMEAYIPTALAQSILDSLSIMARQQGVILRAEFGDGAELERHGDARRIRQILTNLVKNALIHAQATEVTLGFSQRQEPDGRQTAVWIVEDNGRGISAEDADKMFEPFQRGNGKTAMKADGSGLGLYVARTAVSVLSGALTFRQAPTGGAQFEVSIPEDVTTDGTQLLLSPTSETQVDLKTLSVILAEDQDLIAEVLKVRLARHFASVRVVSDGNALLREWSEKPADVVISDLFMPNLGGDEATRKLRSGGFKGPIIGLTASAIEAEAERFVEAGADAVLFKPLDVADLQRAINHLMGSCRV